MRDILLLFQSVSSYAGIFIQLLPLVAIIKAKNQDKLTDNNMKIFTLYILVAVAVQYFTFALSWYYYFMDFSVASFMSVAEWFFNIFSIFQAFLFIYIMLEWIEMRDFFFPIASIILPILLIANYFSTELYPNLMYWIQIAFLLGISFFVSYKIDNSTIILKTEYGYLLLGIYLYCIISLLGLAPQANDLRRLEHILQALAVIVSNYFFYRGFKCLYH